jgi:hypothetical protein
MKKILLLMITPICAIPFAQDDFDELKDFQ